jgi:hypothetical protein
MSDKKLRVADPNVDKPDPHTDPAKKVVNIGGMTRLNLPPETVLDGAVGRLSDVVIIGWGKDEGDFYFASSMTDGSSVLWLLEKAKQSLLAQ